MCLLTWCPPCRILDLGVGARYVPGMEALSSTVGIGLEYVWNFPKQLPWLVVVLLAAGLYVTVRLAFIQLRQVRHAVRVVLGRFDDPNDLGDVNHFQALSTALSATVGIGNIAGVAIAIHHGGPGALFWMWVTAFFGMGLKFAECTLGVYYRQFDRSGRVSGGPMYYIEQGLGRKWRPLAVFFAVCTIVFSFGGGNMNQANTVAVSAASDFGVGAQIVGIVLAVLVGVAIVGGIRTIARVASKLAPTMALFYIIAGLAILVLNASAVPEAFATIFREAFQPRAGVGGVGAGVFSLTLLWGVKRGLFSNEAGLGSAPIAHAAAKTNEPVREGAVAMLGPLIDTLIICTMTGLVIVITGVWNQKRQLSVPLADVGIHVAKHDDSLGGKVVREGIVTGLTFTMHHAAIEQAKLVDAEGRAFDGTLQIDSENLEQRVALGADGKEVEVFVHGKMLQTSSALTAWGFQKGLASLGSWGNFVVTLGVFLFALSTMISWSYYGDRCVTYIWGSRFVVVYRVLYVGFVYLGATTALETVWDFGDLALGLMAVPNLIAVALLMPKVVELTRDYFARMKQNNSVTSQSGGNLG